MTYNERLDLALSAVRWNSLKLKTAARIYNVPFSTLQWRNKHDVGGSIWRGPKPVLDQKYEKELAAAIKEFAALGYGLTRKEVIILHTY